jgi:restriction system protein
MGRFDSGQQRGHRRDHQRAVELEAYQVLWNLWHRARRAAVDISNWETAREMLQTYYTVARARRDSEVCAMRIRYLEISEPLPRLVDFVEAPPHRVPDAPRQLAQVSNQFRLARQRHPERERQRLKELETTKVLLQAVQSGEARAKAAETARRLEWQQSRWPKDVVLESEIYHLDSVEAQVKLQNAKIDVQVRALTDLLRNGLRSPVDAHTGDAAGIAAHVESVLTAMPLPQWITPKASAVYSPSARQLVVDYELPTVEVVPRIKSYRYVKSRERVVATVRAASQTKALYASVIAQLTLLAVAAIVKCDRERHVDAVVFNGVVDVVDSQSGQPIRPCLIAVQVTADALAGIDLSDIDPSACLTRLSATVSDNPTDFVPVRPLTG